jgi:hypothetical protein
MDRELYSIEQARALLGGIARNTLYDLLRSGALTSVPIGRRRFIAAEAIAAFIASASTTGEPGDPLNAAGRKRALALKSLPSSTAFRLPR